MKYCETERLPISALTSWSADEVSKRGQGRITFGCPPISSMLVARCDGRMQGVSQRKK